MQLKPIAAIGLLLLVVASLLVAGCTTSNTNQTPSTSTATHDALLAQYVDAFNQSTREAHPDNLTAWRVMWNNSTAVQVQDSYTYHPSYSNTTTMQYIETNTIIKFSSIDEATKYVDSASQGYLLTRTIYNTTNGAYLRLTGHAPSTYRSYIKSGTSIEQIDQFVWVGEYQSISMP